MICLDSKKKTRVHQGPCHAKQTGPYYGEPMNGMVQEKEKESFMFCEPKHILRGKRVEAMEIFGPGLLSGFMILMQLWSLLMAMAPYSIRDSED